MQKWRNEAGEVKCYCFNFETAEQIEQKRLFSLLFRLNGRSPWMLMLEHRAPGKRFIAIFPQTNNICIPTCIKRSALNHKSYVNATPFHRSLDHLMANAAEVDAMHLSPLSVHSQAEATIMWHSGWRMAVNGVCVCDWACSQCDHRRTVCAVYGQSC